MRKNSFTIRDILERGVTGFECWRRDPRPGLGSIFAGLLAVVSFTCAVQAQQEFPNKAAGARGGSLYSDNGSDQVNLFNGNLSYRIPIGEGLPVGPNLRLAPTLTYNSKTFQRWQVLFDQDYPPQCLRFSPAEEDFPSGDRLFGLGWQLHFGKLVNYPGNYRQILCNNPPGGAPGSASPLSTQPLGMIPTRYAFIEPDGAAHEFYDRLAEACDIANNPTCDPAVPNDNNGQRCWTDHPAAPEHCFVYTHDGSFLRLDPLDPDYGGVPTVYYPDGTIYVLGYEGGRYPTNNLDAYVRREFDYAYAGPNYRSDQWNTTQIRDRFANSITIQYYGQPGMPVHPLAQDLPSKQNQWDAIPYRAFPTASSNSYYQFNLDVDSVADGSNTLYSPRVSSISVPSSKSDGAGGYVRATYSFGSSTITDADSLRYRALSSIEMPENLGYSFSYGSTPYVYGWRLLQQVALPTGGTVDYTWGNVTFWHRTPANCNDFPPPCDGYISEGGDAVATRSTVRAIAGASNETATTTWVRSYKPPGINCMKGAESWCRQRVDVFSPIGLSSGRSVTRTTFWHSDGLDNAGRYGKPMRSDDYFLSTGTPLTSAAVDAASPSRSTLFTYVFDDVSGGANPGPGGVNHNTREQKRRIDWNGTNRYQEIENDPASWDSFGHWRTTSRREFDGVSLRTLRQEESEHLNSWLVWILDPVTSRTVSRPSASTDPPTIEPYQIPNLSTTQQFVVDYSTGFTCETSITDSQDNRVLRTVWRTGSDPNASCTPITNGGFPQVEKTTLTGSRTYPSGSEPSDPRAYTRRYTYSHNTMATAKDDGTSFNVVDREPAPTGKPSREIPPEGRDSGGNVVLSTSYEYDLLGRVVKSTSTDETPEQTSYSTSDSRQILTNWKCATTSDCSLANALWMTRVFFDQLGRPTAHLRRMPGTENYSYQLSTYDEAGRNVSTSEWQGLTGCTDSDPCKTNLLNKQATINTGTAVASPPGTVTKDFEMLGRPTYTRKADGAVMTDSYNGWWQQVNTRGVNTLSPIVPYTYGRDAFGRLSFVTEPATTQADNGGPQNPQRTAYYYYDHADRLIRATSSGTDSNAQNPVTQERTKYFDDFGWLLSEQTPEVPNYEIRARDARGNPVVECTGPTSACGPNIDDTSRNRIARTFDPAGRLVSSTRDTDTRMAQHRPDGRASFEDLYYDTYTYPGVNLNLGRSAGRLVYAVRQNLAWTNNETAFLGWFATQDLYHYNGVGGRLSYRQTNSLLLDGAPLPGSALGPHALAATPVKTNLNLALIQYFRSVGRAKSTPDEGLTTATADPRTSTGAHLNTGRQALDAWTPHGWFRWSFGYDTAGRLSTLTYPRRDEGQATSVSNTFDRGWLTGASANLRDPFNPTGTASVSLSYAPSGNATQTQVYSGATKVFKLLTPDDSSGVARPAQYNAYRGPGDLLLETMNYSYDGSGNLLSFGTNLYGYDARSRLTANVMGGRTEYRRLDDFGNLTLQTVPWRTFNPDRYTNRHSQPNPNPDYREYDLARGYLKYDATSYMGRDFYPDGSVMSEHGRIAPSYATVRDISIYLLGADKDRLLTFNGEDGRCDNSLYRHTLRDPSGRVLTDYKADNQGACNCSSNPCQWTDRFERDYLWLGNQGLVILDRQQSPRFDILDHLGTPRYALNASGNVLGNRVLAPFGEDFSISGSMPERIRFTGHERNHVTGTDGQFLVMSDYMHMRNYAPTLSRFVTPDSKPGFHLFNPEDANRYAYGLNNPTTFVDPTGLDEEGATRIVVSTGKGYGASEEVIGPDPDRERERQLRIWFFTAFNSFASNDMTRYLDQRAEQFRQRGDLQGILGYGIDKLGANTLSPLGAFMLALQPETVGASALKIVFKHGGRHAVERGIASATVDAAIENQLRVELASATGTGEFWGKITVQGRTFVYHAFTKSDGTISVGTYYVPKP